MSVVYKIEDFYFRYPKGHKAIFIGGKLEIYQGDTILLQGASGFGKSTLLLALKGIIPHLINGQLSGSILYNEKNINELDDKERSQIGYLGQNPDNQLIGGTVYQELAFGMENQGISPLIIAQKISRYSNEFNLGNLLKRNVATLSGGEKQKINLLSILLMEPEVLLLDEPTAFLDPANAMEIINIIRQYNKTTIIVEHNTLYLKNLINRLIRIETNVQITEQNLEKTEFTPCLTNYSKANNKHYNSSTNPILKISNLNFAYSKNAYNKKLLDNINLDVYPGQIIGIVGKNGSGKSSLLKLIGKILMSRNAIYYEQKDIKKINTKKYWNKIALVWQNPENHFLYNTVSQELNHDTKLMNEFSLVKNANQNPFCLSEGEKRRLSLAITLKQDVRLFLLDEPSFGQDTANKEVLVKLISHLSSKQKSFIIVSHDILFLQSITNHIYQLNTGHLYPIYDEIE